MEESDNKIYQRTESDSSLNHYSQRGNNSPNMHQHKYNRNMNRNNDGSYPKLTSRSNSNNNDYRNYSHENSFGGSSGNLRNEHYDSSRRQHIRSKSNIDVRHTPRRRGNSIEDYNNNQQQLHLRSKSNGQLNYGYRRPERMNSDRSRSRNRNEVVRNRDRDRDRDRSRDRDRDRERDRSRDRDRGRDRSRDRDRDRSRDRDRGRDNRDKQGNGINDNDYGSPKINNQLDRYPSSSSVTYKQKYQVNASSPLSKPAQFEQDQRKPSLTSLKQSPKLQPSSSQLPRIRNLPNNIGSSASLSNQCPIPTRPHLLKNESSTSLFSEVSISSTPNNHYRFTGNINNNYVGKERRISNNKLTVPNNDLEFDDSASQNYYSSDDSNEDNNNNKINGINEDGYYSQNSIPLVERIDPPQNPQPEKDDVERDRYGFKISYQYISRESQLLFQRNYQVILERREARWNSLIRDNGGRIPQKITDKVKRFIKKGIPQDLRPKCWFKYSGAEEMAKTWPKLYRYLLESEIDDKKKGIFSTPSKLTKSIEEIEKDLYRTFPDNDKFNTDPPTQDDIENNKKDPNAIREIKNPYIKALRNILVAFSYYSIDPTQGGATSDKHSKYTIGYCQSLNYIAGLLLLIFADDKEVRFPEQSFEVEEKCFWMMITLIDEILPIELYEETQMHGAQIEQDVLWDNLVGENGKKFGLSGVAEWVAYMEKGQNIHNRSKYANWNTGGTMPALKSITLPWMLTCFVNVLPIETVLRVWDCLFTEGSKILIRVILTLFRIFKDDITNISDGMTAWMFIKNMPHRIINCHEFMEICFRPALYINPNHIGDDKMKKMNIFNMSHKTNKSNGDRINDLDETGLNLTRSKSDSYRMNFKKGGVGKISQKSIDKFRKIQWDKEQNKKQ